MHVRYRFSCLFPLTLLLGFNATAIEPNPISEGGAWQKLLKAQKRSGGIRLKKRGFLVC